VLAVLGLAVGCGGGGSGGTAHDGGDAAVDQGKESLGHDGMPDAGGGADVADAMSEAGGPEGPVAADAMPEGGGPDGDVMRDAMPESGGADGQDAEDAPPAPVCDPPDPGAPFHYMFDLNHDGRQDIIQGIDDPFTAGTQAPGSLLQLYRGQADGTFMPSEGTPGVPGLPCGRPVGGLFRVSAPPVIADFDGDGQPDLALVTVIPTTYAQFFWLVLKSAGGLDFSDAQSVGLSGVRGGAATIAGTGNFNGDNKLDIVVLVYSGDPFNFPGFVAVALGRGDGSFDATTTVSGTSGATSVSVGDANTDGKLDLTVTLPGGPTVFYGDGAGSFSTTPP
jgi:hypothetical protein